MYLVDQIGTISDLTRSFKVTLMTLQQYESHFIELTAVNL